MGRIGFCCKWIDRPDQVNGVKRLDEARQYNTGATTVAWLKRQTREVAEQKLWDLMIQNIDATQRLVQRVGEHDEHLRMVRISSDILPVYTEPNFRYFWAQPDVRRTAEQKFNEVGGLARSLGVRLSFHPGQFCVLASDRPDVVERSIEEFEYHADMARWMGYGQRFQDFKINVHISGRLGPEGIRAVYPRLSEVARNCITIENEEITHGLDHCLSIADIVPVVLDIHHHWIREGLYIDPTCDSVKRVMDSWRGVRPAMHYSVSREDYLLDHPRDQLPDMPTLLAKGYKKSKLRAHSDFYWNSAVNAWAAEFSRDFDIQCELKSKNIGRDQFAEYCRQS